MRQFPLLDFEFLRNLDHERNRTTYARITSLTLDNYPIDRIEGVVTAGSISLDGDSAVRRVCNLSLTTGKFNINNVYWGLSTRVKIEIGIKNNLIEYKDIYDEIIWFNQGVYVLTDFSTSAQVNNYSISLSGKDKMCLLNGDVSGTFNAETVLDSERVEQEDGTWKDEKRPIYYIIREMIHHYAQESFHNIIIKDIDTLSLRVLSNRKTTFYLVQTDKENVITDIFYLDRFVVPSLKHEYRYKNTPIKTVNFNNLDDDFHFYAAVDEDDIGLIDPSQSNYEPTLIIDENNVVYHVTEIQYGEDIGYELVETYYPDELIAGIGETVTSILDKIIETFGAFEYFYNLDGQFVFQAKQTYVNTAWNNYITIEKEKYIAPAMVSSQVTYMFEGSELTTAYQNAPNLGEIKNDFTVWGKKKNSSDIEIPIHMRYAIDLKPDFYWSFEDKGYISEDFFEIIDNEYFYDTNEDGTITLNNEIYSIVDWREIIYQMAKDYYKHNHDDDYEVQLQRHNNKTFEKRVEITNLDGTKRTESLPIEFKPYERGRTGYEQYYHDIEGFWRLLYAPKEYLDNYNTDNAKYPIYTVNTEDFYSTIVNPETGVETLGEYIGPWNKNVIQEPSALLFWFDFFDANDLGLGQFSVPAIGDRPKEENNDAIHSLIYKDIPDIIFIEESLYREYEKNDRLLDGYDYIVFIDEATYNQYAEENNLSNRCMYSISYNNMNYIQESINNGDIRVSSRSLTAHESIDDLLYNYAYSNETITITSVPIYYLEPNTIISAEDEQRKVNGYYIINKISLPLDYKGTMSITAIKVPERVY